MSNIIWNCTVVFFFSFSSLNLKIYEIQQLWSNDLKISPELCHYFERIILNKILSFSTLLEFLVFLYQTLENKLTVLSSLTLFH